MSLTPTALAATVAPKNCFHEKFRLAYRTAGRQKQYFYQCFLCGSELICDEEETTVMERIAAKPLDWSLRSSGQHLDYCTERKEQDGEWQEQYQKHLASPKWLETRKRVMLRCQGICEGCRKSPAVHVHHMTYARMGHEMLFDLVGVCLDCHQSIHPTKEIK